MDGRSHSEEPARLGWALRELRARRGLSQEALGFSSGLHRNYVGAVERGEINASFLVLIKLAAGLDFPLSEVIRLWEKRAGDPLPRHVPRVAGRRRAPSTP